MFTGIVEEIGTVKSIRTQQSVRTLDISCQKIIEDMHIGDSISFIFSTFNHLDRKLILFKINDC
jgi:riboflavin synthase